MGNEFIFILLILPVVVEATTQLIGDSDIFGGIREWVKAKSKFFNDLFSCKYCLSVWISLFITMTYFGVKFFVWQSLPYYFIVMLFIHRLSNFYHLIFDIVNEYKLYRWSIIMGSVEE
jgi:hypothetical protein